MDFTRLGTRCTFKKKIWQLSIYTLFFLAVLKLHRCLLLLTVCAEMVSHNTDILICFGMIDHTEGNEQILCFVTKKQKLHFTCIYHW